MNFKYFRKIIPAWSLKNIIASARYTHVFAAKKNDTLFEPKKENVDKKGAMVQFKTNKQWDRSIRGEPPISEIKQLVKTGETVENSR